MQKGVLTFTTSNGVQIEGVFERNGEGGWSLVIQGTTQINEARFLALMRAAQNIMGQSESHFYMDIDIRHLHQVLSESIDILGDWLPIKLKVRALNGMQNAKIKTIGEFVQWSEGRLIRVQNFGIGCLDAMKDALLKLAEARGVILQIGMDVKGWTMEVPR